MTLVLCLAIVSGENPPDGRLGAADPEQNIERSSRPFPESAAAPPTLLVSVDLSLRHAVLAMHHALQPDVAGRSR